MTVWPSRLCPRRPLRSRPPAPRWEERVRVIAVDPSRRVLAVAGPLLFLPPHADHPLLRARCGRRSGSPDAEEGVGGVRCLCVGKRGEWLRCVGESSRVVARVVGFAECVARAGGISRTPSGSVRPLALSFRADVRSALPLSRLCPARLFFRLSRSIPPTPPDRFPPPLPPTSGFARASYLVDPASSICLSQRLSHACLSTHGRYSETANGSLNQLWFLWSLAPLLLG